LLSRRSPISESPFGLQTPFKLCNEAQKSALFRPTSGTLLEPRPAEVIDLLQALLLVAVGCLFLVTALALLAFALLLGGKRGCAYDPADDFRKSVSDLLVFGLNPLRLPSAQVGSDHDAEEAGAVKPGLVMIGISGPLGVLSPRDPERLDHPFDYRASDLAPANPERHLADDRCIVDMAAGLFDSPEDRAGNPVAVEVPFRKVLKQRSRPRPSVAPLTPVFLLAFLLLALCSAIHALTFG